MRPITKIYQMAMAPLLSASVVLVAPLTCIALMSATGLQSGANESMVDAQPKYKPVVVMYDLPLEATNTYEYALERARELRSLRRTIYDSIDVDDEMPVVSHKRMYTKAEHECLAKNIYFEARQESILGQVGVALVTLLRVNDARYPGDICGVITQGGELVRHKCHFSWYCDGKPDIPTEKQAYRLAQDIATIILDPETEIPDFTFGATHYHADYVDPYWAPMLVKLTTIETHIFYREDPIYYVDL